MGIPGSSTVHILQSAQWAKTRASFLSSKLIMIMSYFHTHPSVALMARWTDMGQGPVNSTGYIQLIDGQFFGLALHYH